MQSTTPSPICLTASPTIIQQIALGCLVGAAALTLGACVSPQTYESAQQEGKARAYELAQVQADIQGLEQQRDAAHAANQHDERALGVLKNELRTIQTSFDQIKKDNQARLAELQHRIAVLRARHQLMIKEISETKRHDKQLEALTAKREQAMAPSQSGSDAHVTTVDGHPSEPRMVAVITPRPPQSDALSSSSISPAPSPSPQDVPAAAIMNPPPATLHATSTVSAVPVPAGTPAKPALVTPANAASASVPPAPQHDSWFSTMTEWLATMFDWLWS